MEYTKPQVTIDLEEYNSLLTLKTLSEIKEDQSLDNKALSIFLTQLYQNKMCFKTGSGKLFNVGEAGITFDKILQMIFETDKIKINYFVEPVNDKLIITITEIK